MAMGKPSSSLRGEGEIQQAVGVVEGRPQELAARHILVDGGDAPGDGHACRLERQARGEARQGGAVGAQKEDCLHEIPRRLLDGESCEAPVIEPAFRHDTIDGEAKLALDLPEGELGRRRIATPVAGEQLVGGIDGGLAALDGYIHMPSRRMLRGRPHRRVPQVTKISTPRGKSA